MHCAWPGDCNCLSLKRIQFNPTKVIPLTNLADDTLHGLGYSNSNAWEWRNSHETGHRHNWSAYSKEWKTTQTIPLSKLGGWKHINNFTLRQRQTDIRCAQTPKTILMLWKPVGNWQKRMMDLSEMASELQIYRLPGLLAVKMIWQQISLTNRFAHQSTTPSASTDNDEVEPNTIDLKVDHR